MMLMEGRDPAATLQGLDAFAATIPGASCATVTCAVVNRSAGTITYSSAGHPPTLVVDAHGARWLVGATATPLAVGSPERVNATESLAVGDVIVLYSDGLVERRGEPIDDGLERLAAAATALHGDSVQRIADELLRRLSPENTRDDVVLVVKSFEAV
jgi:serine phosphatase RsbU (regulator of sigma subunit)